MIHATATRHAERIAYLMERTLPEVLESAPDRAMLVLLLFAIGYTDRKVRMVLVPAIPMVADHRMPAELDRALHLWRTDNRRKLQYRHILDTLNREDDERAKETGRVRKSGIGRHGEAGGKPVAMDSGQRGAPAMGARSGQAPRNKATHQPPGATHC